MSGPEILEQHSGPMRTRAGAAFPGQRAVFRGHDLHADLKHMNWVELFAFGITGLRFSPQQVQVLNAMFVVTSYPDPRLWNNRVAALAGSARSTGALGVAAAVAASEAKTFGWQPLLAGADFLVRAHRALAAGSTLLEVLKSEIAQHKYLGGYGRPVATCRVDERIPELLECMRAAGVEQGPYLRLAFAVEQGLQQLGRKLTINYAVMSIAVALDMGFSPLQCYMFMQASFLAGKSPCYLEALERPEGATFPLRCSQVQYRGPARRSW